MSKLVKGFKKIFQEKQTGVAMLTSDKAEFKAKLIKRDQKVQFILINRTIKRK
jgi:hypothetical protein